MLATEILPVTARDLRSIGRRWRFDWRTEVKHSEVFKLVAKAAPATIQGLMAIRRREGFVEVTLLESSPTNVGGKKRFKGVAGSLLAFAARLSFQLGGEGFVTLIAKTELIDHYRDQYGFVRLGNSQKMVLDTLAAAKLIATFHRGTDDGDAPRAR